MRVHYFCAVQHAAVVASYLPALLRFGRGHIQPTLVTDGESELAAIVRGMDVPVVVAAPGSASLGVVAPEADTHHVLSADYLPALAHARAQTAKVVWQLLASYPVGRRGRRLQQHCDVAWATLDATLTRSRIIEGVSERVVIPAGAADAAFAGERPSRAPRSYPTVGMVARDTTHTCAQHYFFETADQLTRKGVRANWVVRAEPELTQRHADDGSERYHFFDDLDVLILPNADPDPILMCEAMARGLPIVAAAVPGTDELVETGVTAWLVPPRDSIAIARATSFLLRNPGQARAMGLRAQEKAARQHRASDHFAAVHALYGAAKRRETPHSQPLETTPEVTHAS